MNGLQEDLFQCFVNIGDPAAVQISSKLSVLVPFIIWDFTEIQEDLKLVGIQFCKQALFIDFTVIPDVFQAVDVIPEDDKNAGIVGQIQALAQ